MTTLQQTAVLADAAPSLTILYGSQTGNGQGVAEELAGRARALGYGIRLASFADFKPSALKRERLVSIVVSTHGEGDPPDDAELFHEYLLSDKAPALSGLRFSVLALGDSSYVNFCQTGREFDQRLADLGAERLLPMVECDLDFESPAAAWTEDLLATLPENTGKNDVVPQLRAVSSEQRYGKSSPFPAQVLLNQKITGSGSSKDVRHIELSLEGSGLRYEPGDSLAVVAKNPLALVRQLVEQLGLDVFAEVDVDDETIALFDALSRKLEITALNLGFLRAWAGFSGADELTVMLEPEQRDALGELIATHQVIDIVQRFPAAVAAQQFVDSLRKLAPRSYSIASSLEANPDEVHLTVAALRYDAFGHEHWGAASTYLADRVKEGQKVQVFVESNPRFRLPDDNSAPIIMIGPGTGVAPFRAFVEERAARAASGENWLIFGERNFRSDFLYQVEWQRYLKLRQLHRLDVAFSRDQRDKIYVQDRIRENASLVRKWIERGAYIYVCGDAKYMARDVHDALADSIGETRLRELRRDGRYQKDVY